MVLSLYSQWDIADAEIKDPLVGAQPCPEHNEGTHTLSIRVCIYNNCTLLILCSNGNVPWKTEIVFP